MMSISSLSIIATDPHHHDVVYEVQRIQIISIYLCIYLAVSVPEIGRQEFSFLLPEITVDQISYKWQNSSQ